MERFTQAVKCRSEGKVSLNVLFDNGVGQWRSADPRAAQMHPTFEHVWSNTPAVQQLCRRFKAEFTMSSNQIVCSLQGSEGEIKQFRTALNALQSPEKAIIPASDALFDANGNVHLEACKQFTKLGQAYDVSIIVTRSQIYLVGLEKNVQYARYKCKVLLEHLGGACVDKVDLPLSVHNLVFGPCKMHLLNIFEQTAVNTHAPPSLLAGTVPNAEWDHVYLVGDPAQVAVAKIMLQEITTKTDVLLQTCVVALPTLDVLYRHHGAEIQEIMNQFATFVQWPRGSSTVRVLGTTRKSIQCTVSALMKLCGRVYTMLVSGGSSKATMLSLAKTGVSVHSSKSELVLLGTQAQSRAAAQLLSTTMDAGVSVTYTLELDLQLKDFLAGKKNGKISKVMTQANSRIWFEPFHEHNLRVMMQCPSAADAATALALLEDELPAEETVYIPEPFHKQIIGAGGARIQTLMRRYNVYIKFEANSDKVPNAVANLQLDNVLVRCPRKHSANIKPAIADLQENVAECRQEHRTTYLKLSRNHRRLLVSTHANLIREIERWSNAVINWQTESRFTELLEISGLADASILAAKRLQEHLPYDYEFRIAHTPKFGANVGPQSTFAERVTLPLRAAFNAQVQAFERVQMERDATVYSQIMVSIAAEDDFVINEIDQIVTSYLRDHGLDIIEKGPISTNLIVDGTAALWRPSSVNTPSEGKFAGYNIYPVNSENTFSASASAGTPMRKKSPVKVPRTPMTPTPLNQGPPALSWKNARR